MEHPSPPTRQWAALRRRWPLLALTVTGLVLHQVCEALVPVVIGVVIDRAIEPGDAAALVAGLAGLAALFLVLAFSWRLGRVAGARAAEAAGFELRQGLVRRVLDRRGMARSRRPGELVTIAGGDVDRTVRVIWVIGGALARAAAVITVAVSLLLISVPLGIAVLVATPVLLVGLHLVAGPLERRSEAEQSSIAHAGAVAGDLLTGLRTLKGLGAEQAAVHRFETANQQSWRHARRAADLVGAYVGVSSALSALFLAGLAWFAGMQAMGGNLTVGELVAVLGLAQFLQWPMSGLAFVGAELATARASAVRVAQVQQAPPVWDRLTGPGADPGTAAGVGLELRGLRGASFGPIDLTVPAGTIVAVCADESAAATELVDVLARRTPATGGTMLVAGEAVTGPDRLADAAAVPVVVAPPHHAAILSGTIVDNVLPGVPADDPRLTAAAGAAAFDDVLREADDGWSARVGERGLTLSGGQRQRLALTRALAADAPVLVLHDPTSAVDSVTELGIAAGLREMRRDRATVLVTASPALLATADHVLVLRGGRVVDAGRHHDLVAHSDRYRERIAG